MVILGTKPKSSYFLPMHHKRQDALCEACSSNVATSQQHNTEVHYSQISSQGFYTRKENSIIFFWYLQESDLELIGGANDHTQNFRSAWAISQGKIKTKAYVLVSPRTKEVIKLCKKPIFSEIIAT